MLAVGARAEQMTQAMRSLEAAFLIGVEGATEIWLVRHADCYEGMADGGDPPLSPLGRQQAERLAERVRRKSSSRRLLQPAPARTRDGTEACYSPPGSAKWSRPPHKWGGEGCAHRPTPGRNEVGAG